MLPTKDATTPPTLRRPNLNPGFPSPTDPDFGRKVDIRCKIFLFCRDIQEIVSDPRQKNVISGSNCGKRRMFQAYRRRHLRKVFAFPHLPLPEGVEGKPEMIFDRPWSPDRFSFFRTLDVTYVPRPGFCLERGQPGPAAPGQPPPGHGLPSACGARGPPAQLIAMLRSRLPHCVHRRGVHGGLGRARAQGGDCRQHDRGWDTWHPETWKGRQEGQTCLARAVVMQSCASAGKDLGLLTRRKL
jgi:hypothetical protein